MTQDESNKKLERINRLFEFLETLGDETLARLEEIGELMSEVIDSDDDHVRFAQLYNLVKDLNANDGIQSLFWICTRNESFGDKMPLELIGNDESFNRLTAFLSKDT